MPEKSRSAAVVEDKDQKPSKEVTAAASGDSRAREMLSRVTESAHQTVDRMAERAGPAVEKLETGVLHANESLTEQAHRMREMGDAWTQSLRGTVRKNPLTSVLLAATAGALIARMTR